MKDIRNGLTLKSCGVPPANPSQLLSCPPEAPSDHRGALPRPPLALLSEICGAKKPLKHLNVLPKPGRLALTKKAYQPSTYIPFASHHERLMREIKFRVAVVKASN
jgi:hypothetical protein